MTRIALTIFSLTLAGLAACASRGPVYQGMSADSLLQVGLNKLEQRKWDDAAQALQQFTFQFPTHARYQEARFRIGDAYFGKKEFISAAAEYSRLSNDYPAGPYADDARFRVCESYARLSPKPQLDQQYTHAAIDHCQSLVAYYPQSPFVAEAQEITLRMQNKLAEKMFTAGEYYFKIRAYDSAVKYFDTTLKAYPQARVTPRVLYRLFEAYQELGYREEADTTRERLLSEFPTSEEARRLQGASVVDVG